MSTIEFNSSSSLCTLSTCLLIQTSTDYQHICGDPVSYQSLVSWVERQSRLVELNDVPLPQAAQQQICISRSLTPASQGNINCIFCVEIFIDPSRSQGTKNGILHLLPPLMYRVPQYVLPTAKSQKNQQFNIKLYSLFRTQPMHLHKCHLTILSLLHMRVAYSRKHCRMA